MNNLPYTEELYEIWKENPNAVDPVWRDFFQQHQPLEARPPEGPPGVPKSDMIFRQGRVDSLLWAYRDIGYLYARLNPLGGNHGREHDYLHRSNGNTYERLSPQDFRLAEADLDAVFSAGRAMRPSNAPLRDIIDAFQETYCGSIGVEFLHIQDKRMRHWLIEKMESTRNQASLTDRQRRVILQDLQQTESLEHALHQAFVGQKRFSLEGSEAIIPGLHFLVDSANGYSIDEFVIGTTHRGRLAILNTILDMSPEQIFGIFDKNFQPGMRGGTGDVKYHMGYETDHMHEDGSVAHISMVANSSHLESVNAVVQGKARALQDLKYGHNSKRVLPVILHGDAAFSGQGVVAEVLNLSRLEGYTTGGTIHIIINNQIGFTTPTRHARSSLFPTDMAKALPIPIFHINGDDPEALVYAADLALQFRQTFGTDCVLDVFCYRRYGHNEADEPSFTQPYMYKLIKDHASVATLYSERCAELGVVSEPDQAILKETYTKVLKDALDRVRSQPITQIDSSQGAEWEAINPEYSHESVDTGVPASTLERIMDHVTSIPEGFHAHRTLARILTRKRKAFGEDQQVDWAVAEMLAFGSLLLEGVPVRLSGEDCARGTFSHRHLTWWDAQSERPRPYTPLQTLGHAQAELAVFDSPLSEYSVLGFEYGYSLVNPDSLVVWEAQFGDFCNGAQVMIDNYIASAHVKWGRSSGLVLLLPHGNEGQGPDHSSAHLARFLQLAACDNMLICNVTTPAQYFHLLRRQVKLGFRRPLVVMAPKSLLRHPKVVSPVSQLVDGQFQAVLDDSCDPAQVERVVLCSGKIYYDLMAQHEAGESRACALIRLEQLYPFPEAEIKACLEKYSSAQDVVWVQEEPRNWGGWGYISEQFAYHHPQIDLQRIARKESASSAGGSLRQHEQRQQRIVRKALQADIKHRPPSSGQANTSGSKQ
jgi:2-oxoglutarate dehydrogenase E1 component